MKLHNIIFETQWKFEKVAKDLLIRDYLTTDYGLGDEYVSILKSPSL